MRRKKSLLIPAVLAFSLCTGAVIPVLAEETWQTADTAAMTNADNKQEAHTQSATDVSDSPYEKGTITDTDFQSEWLNLKFTPPETVVMNTEEELQSVMKQGQTTLEEASGEHPTSAVQPENTGQQSYSPKKHPQQLRKH